MQNYSLGSGTRGRHCWEIHLLHLVCLEKDILIQMQMVYMQTSAVQYRVYRDVQYRGRPNADAPLPGDSEVCMAPWSQLQLQLQL